MPNIEYGRMPDSGLARKLLIKEKSGVYSSDQKM
jgi:hypothetical protein